MLTMSFACFQWDECVLTMSFACFQWDECVLTMGAGEVVELEIESEWAYGRKGLEGKYPFAIVWVVYCIDNVGCLLS